MTDPAKDKMNSASRMKTITSSVFPCFFTFLLILSLWILLYKNLPVKPEDTISISKLIIIKGRKTSANVPNIHPPKLRSDDGAPPDAIEKPDVDRPLVPLEPLSEDVPIFSMVNAILENSGSAIIVPKLVPGGGGGKLLDIVEFPTELKRFVNLLLDSRYIEKRLVKIKPIRDR